MFDKIQNPATGKWVNTNGPVGRKVLNNYVRQAGGGDEEARMQGALGAVRKYWLDGENDYTHTHADLQVKLGIAENAMAKVKEKHEKLKNSHDKGAANARRIAEVQERMQAATIEDIKEQMRELDKEHQQRRPF